MPIHNNPTVSSCKRQWSCRRRPSLTILLICSAIACATLMTTMLATPTHAAPFSPFSPSFPRQEQSELKGRFFHMTDLHPDGHYLEGAAVSAACHTIDVSEGGSNDAGGQKKRDDGGQLYLAHRLIERTTSTVRPDVLHGTSHSSASSLSSSSSSSSAALVNTTIAGRYGAPNTICDSPMGLIDATFEWIDRNIVDSVDFVVWTGDNARHDSDNIYPRSQEEINTLNKIIATKVLDTFPPDLLGRRVPIIPSIGNNDIYPHNILQPGPNPILQSFAKIWTEFIPEAMTKTFARGGYFSVEAVADKITVFSLNTLYFYSLNVAVDGCNEEEQPGTEQMDWLEVELKILRERKMVAYLTGHVPPDKKSFSPTCYARYTKIALAFQDVIVGHLYGHANVDHFFLLSRGAGKESGEDEGGSPEIPAMDNSTLVEEKPDVKSNESRAMSLAAYLVDLWTQYDSVHSHAQLKDYAIVMVSPSVIPTYNPSLRVFSYQLDNHNDDDTQDDYEDDYNSRRLHRRGPGPVSTTTFGFPQEYTQYWCNLTHANEHPSQTLTYEIEYRTREDYGLENLGVSEMLGLARRIRRDEDLKKVYLDRMVVQTGSITDAE